MNGNVLSARASDLSSKDVFRLVNLAMPVRSTDAMNLLPRAQRIAKEERLRLLGQAHEKLQGIVTTWDRHQTIGLGRGMSQDEIAREAHGIKTALELVQAGLHLVKNRPPELMQAKVDETSDVIMAWLLSRLNGEPVFASHDFFEDRRLAPDVMKISAGCSEPEDLISRNDFFEFEDKARITH